MNNDLISRAALLREWFKKCDRECCTCIEWDDETADCGLIRYAPAVDVEPKWVSVEDRLPENDNPVLCWYLSGDGNYYHTVGICLRFNFGYIWDVEIDANDCGYGCKKVTHWMPLPEPPKEEEHHE